MKRATSVALFNAHNKYTINIDMNKFNEIIADLRHRYAIDGPIDISPFFVKGEKWLYNVIQHLHNDKFHDNHRIVLYFDKDDYFYANHVGLLVKKLQQIISEVDISNYFIILISTDEIHNDLILVQDEYSTDLVSISHIQCDDIDAQFNPLVNNDDSFCIKPFVHLYVDTDGGVAPCCQSTVVSHMDDGAINDIINSTIIHV